MHFKTLSDWMRAPGGGSLDVKSFDILEIKSVRISRLYRFGALYDEWVRKKEEGYTHKIWVTIGDEKTRPDHRAANGQKVKIDEMFIVGGEELFLPSDIAGSLEQTANCRCKVAYVKEPGHTQPTPAERPQERDTTATQPVLPPFGATDPDDGLPKRFIVNLDEHEGGRHHGHTKRKHVGKSDDQLRRLMETPRQRGVLINNFRSSHGTFSNVQEGNKWAGAVLNRNRATIERYLESSSRARLKLNAVFNQRTGREAYRLEKYSTRFVHRRLSAIQFRNTIAVRVTVLKSDEHAWGFAIETAFPFQP
ncbi:MAG: RNase A-like domain-containing protein [Pseudomonadota bacterium]